MLRPWELLDACRSSCSIPCSWRVCNVRINELRDACGTSAEIACRFLDWESTATSFTFNRFDIEPRLVNACGWMRCAKRQKLSMWVNFKCEPTSSTCVHSSTLRLKLKEHKYTHTRDNKHFSRKQAGRFTYRHSGRQRHDINIYICSNRIDTQTIFEVTGYMHCHKAASSLPHWF